MVLSKDQNYLVSGSNDDTVAIWDVKTHKNLKRLYGPKNVF